MKVTKPSEIEKNGTEKPPVNAVVGGSRIVVDLGHAIPQNTITDVVEELVDELKHLHKHGITMARIAKMVGCSHSAVSKFERGSMVFTTQRATEILASIHRWERSIAHVSSERLRNKRS